MNNRLSAPVMAGLALGVAFVMFFSIMTSQMPPFVKTSIELVPEVIDTRGTIPVSTAKERVPGSDSREPYAMIPVGRSKEVIISNSGWGMGLRHINTLMTIDNITIYYNDYNMQQSLSDLFEQKDGYFVIFLNHTMKNLGDSEYYALIAVDAITSEGKRYSQEAYSGALTSPLYPNESRSSWLGLQVPQDADEIILEITDAQTNRKVWMLQLDMQPYGLNPSKDSKEKDFSQLPDDFSLIYSYGIGNDITLDSKKELIIVNTCDDPQLQNVTVSLSREQLQTIWHTALQNDFFALPDFTESCPSEFSNCVGIEPESSARLRVTGYNQTHIVDFRQSYEMNLRGTYDADFEKYKNISTFLEEMISGYELPRSQCAYL